MKIALCQLNPIVGDYRGNAQKIVRQAEEARERGADLAVFSELCLCGYPPRDLLERPDFLAAGEKTLQGLVRSISGIGVVVGLASKNPRQTGKTAVNRAVLFEDGRILHVADKRLLPTYDVFDEARYFEPGTEAEPFLYKGMKIGLTVCEDVWNDADFFPTHLYGWDPVEALRQKGAELLVNISASPFHAGKVNFRQDMLAHLAKKHGIATVYVNQVGGNDSLLFDGTSSVYGADGNLAARARDFEEDLVLYDLEKNRGRVRELSPSNTDAVYRALVMGLGDYTRKCGFADGVVGLSGGVDSALVLCLAARALGGDHLTAVFMPSPYTSQQNFEDTRVLAENLGVRYEVVPIAPMYEAFLTGLSPHTQKDDPTVTEQNIQARIRGIILMAFSNRYGSLVLSTGNKSELAVGYSTLYGDMCGGLAAISDVPKILVYEICRHINRDREIIPESILTKAPSAELKADQRDDDDLPPYEILDPILEAYVEDLKDPDEIAAMGFDPEVVRDVVRRVIRNEYKRRQAAPGLKITPKAFGEGRRYPIAQRYGTGG